MVDSYDVADKVLGMDTAKKTAATPFRPTENQEQEVRALCAATAGPAKPTYADMMRALLDLGISAAKRRKAKR